MPPSQASSHWKRMSLAAIASSVGAVFAAQAESQLEEALSNSYAPQYVECPTDIQWIRPPLGLSQAEADWVYGRKQVVANALATYLEQLNMECFDLPEYICQLHQSNYSNVPTLGLAISGGGWASAFTGTGALSALDSRIDDANTQRTGGLLQSLTYLSGLSGGSWPTMSLSVNNLPSIENIASLWQPEIDRLLHEGPTTNTVANATSVFEDLGAKAKAGFGVGVADYIGRSVSYEFVTGYKGGLGVTYSSVVNQSKFQTHQMPFPIIQGNLITEDDQEYFGLRVPYSNATIFDMTPFEFGAWSGSVSGFTPMEWVGTELMNGSVVNASACVQGFDRASFIIGTSAGAFNFWYIEGKSNYTLAPFAKRAAGNDRSVESTALSKRSNFPPTVLDDLVDTFDEYFHLNVSQIGYALWPNSFAGLASSSPLSNTPRIRVVDASEDGQAIPLWGQIQSARGSSFIVAWDDNSDAAPYNWNNGTNLHNTYLAAKAAALDFPIVPPATTFVNRNYTHSPVFFGCDAKLTTRESADSPIVLYLANAPYSAYTNYSYAQTATTREQLSEIFTNSFNLVTQGNGTLDAEWPVCLGCAVIDRSLPKMGMKRTEQCDSCFNRYCWDGTEDNMATEAVDLALVLDPELGFLEWNKTHPF